MVCPVGQKGAEIPFMVCPVKQVVIEIYFLNTFISLLHIIFLDHDLIR